MDALVLSGAICGLGVCVCLAGLIIWFGLNGIAKAITESGKHDKRIPFGLEAIAEAIKERGESDKPKDEA